MSLFKQIKKIVCQIPQGKVSTYGVIARAVGISDARQVGWAMHGNTNPFVPCHRVVYQNGGLAPNHAFGGAGRQKEKLKKEGIRFKNEKQVDLKQSLFVPAAVKSVNHQCRQPNNGVNSQPN